MRILLFIWLCYSRASGCNAGHYGCLCDAWLWYEHELTDALFACYAEILTYGGKRKSDTGTIRTYASEDNRFRIYRVRPLRHGAMHFLRIL
jgi:hypothetical protein